MKRFPTTASVSALAIGLIASGLAVGTASPVAAAACTATPTTWTDLQDAFANAPLSGGVICLGADISDAAASPMTGANMLLSQPGGSDLVFDLNGHSLTRVLNRGGSNSDVAGINVDAGKTLTIDATGGGSLLISGGAYSAAIGASNGNDLGTIIINGGTIDVSTLWDGAGIGATNFSMIGGGSITINGGDITATTYSCGPGIGAGEYASVPADITITGGTVTAHGTCGSPGIGGAGGASGGNITITGGVITATATQGAGIGGAIDSPGANITMSGGELTASTVPNGGYNGAALGTGYTFGNGPLRDPGTLTLIGAGVPTPTSGSSVRASSPMATVQPGVPGVTFTQTTEDGTATDGPRTHIVFARPVAPQITTPTVADGTVGAAYSQTLDATGTGPLTFALSAGALPPGLTLDPVAGVISGQPTQAGSFTFTVEVSGPGGTTSRSYTVMLAAAPSSTPSATATPSVTPAPASPSAASPAAASPAAPKKLAATGADTAGLIVAGTAGAALLLAGALAGVLRRRRLN
ncbi:MULTISPECIES: putative Ig domain-containing protein [Microbacterium]|uniref:putative Ig domain-containing protein n=1 Tax=Microbacterium TaxID=33882 RepID=UPI00278A016C|nr:MULTISPECIES: putative Ig domain-containing protein [Microbacterium]MDQ1082429.1 hypothetical protein [Microbacterium sp. SORGH_AS_0344]MDQ1168800.1 hypothetical protein [Microbacterium proteolyticum]